MALRAYRRLARVANDAAILITDLALALVMLPFVAALLLALQAYYLHTGQGCVLYCQKRVGYKGRTFRIFKIKTMVPRADQLGNHWTEAGDPRVTPLGARLRRWAVDETPQCINVLLLQMSFFGPRALSLAHEELCAKHCADLSLEWHNRYAVRPGVADCTKPVRVQGNGDGPAGVRAVLLVADLSYAACRTWWGNIGLAWKIVRAMKSGHDDGG